MIFLIDFVINTVFCIMNDTFLVSFVPGEQLPADQAAGRLLLLRGGAARGARRPRQVLRRARPQDDQGHQPRQEEEGLGEEGFLVPHEMGGGLFQFRRWARLWISCKFS